MKDTHLYIGILILKIEYWDISSNDKDINRNTNLAVLGVVKIYNLTVNCLIKLLNIIILFV